MFEKRRHSPLPIWCRSSKNKKRSSEGEERAKEKRGMEETGEEDGTVRRVFLTAGRAKKWKTQNWCREGFCGGSCSMEFVAHKTKSFLVLFAILNKERVSSSISFFLSLFLALSLSLFCLFDCFQIHTYIGYIHKSTFLSSLVFSFFFYFFFSFFFSSNLF